MESTREEAIAVLNRWKANSSEIQVMLAADGIRLGFRARWRKYPIPRYSYSVPMAQKQCSRLLALLSIGGINGKSP
jgi:hypothetical protein